MYRKKDFETINLNIDKIKTDAIVEYKKNYEPTITEQVTVYNSIKKFIITNKRIVYGGVAQNLLIKNKNPKDTFYTEIDGVYYNWPDLADIEFYSPVPLEDIYNLTNYLLNLGFKYIEAKEGVHPETFKIFVNFINYCDITYMPKYIYYNLPTIIIENIVCTNKLFMLIDAYRVITDPLTSYWRLDKSIIRFQKILSYYPFNINLLKNNKEIEDIIKPTKDTNIMLYIRKKLIHNSNLVVVGFYAYNYYISKINKKAILNNFPYYEVISNNLKNDSKIIYNILKKKYSLTIKEYYPFFQFLDRRIEYYHNNKLILVLYGNNSRCTVYRYSLKKKTYFGTFNLILMYFLINYFYNIINKMYKKSKLYLILLIKLWYNRNLYLSKYNITVFDSSPFQDFTLKCHGIPVHPLRKSLLQNLKKKKFKFNPSKDNIIKEQTFDNTSGNQILNEKYLILKNNI
jgi:hypothetical protein